MSMQSARPGGHVFLVRGKVQNLACDAWGVSCDHRARPRLEKWLPEHMFQCQPPYELPSPPPGWGYNGLRTFKLENWPDKDGPRPWLLYMGSTSDEDIAWYIRGLREFFASVAEDFKGKAPLYGRAKHLVALPPVGTGRGGLRDRVGEAVLELLPALYDIAEHHDLDIALTLLHRPSFAAAQADRSKLVYDGVLPEDKIWPAELTATLRQEAENLARYASQGKLALFLGAGVSKSAGLPLWPELLDRLVGQYGLQRLSSPFVLVRRSRTIARQERGLAHGAFMNAARKELALVLEHVGVPIDLQSFSNRLNVQKKVYLAQIAGTDLGYRYGWYIRGPYSTGLTQDAFALKDEISSGETEYQAFQLAPKVTKALDTAKKIWASPPKSTMSDDDWLELLASLHYLKHIAYRPHGAKRDFDEVSDLLIQAKPQFKKRKEEARAAWKRLDEFGLVNAKTLS